MKFGIIGSGCSGLFLSILLKKKFLDSEVFVIDKNKIVGRKLYVTGNGRCNLGNLNLDTFSYNEPFANNLVKKYGIKDEINFLNSIGIKTRNLDNLVYPYSLSAKSFTDFLINYALKIGVNFINEEILLDYKLGSNILVKTNKNEYFCDKLFIACGGKSNPNLGSDGSIFDILIKHNYDIENCVPGLCPIKVFENTKSIENERLKCLVKLEKNSKIIHEEQGEVLFKKDGLSGICIMNLASIISRDKIKNCSIILDPFYDLEESFLNADLKDLFLKNGIHFLDGYFTKNISNFIIKNSINKNQNTIELNDINLISKYCKNISFKYKENYSFNDSHVTVGGVLLNNIKDTFESKIEKNVYILGETLNLDGLCGGYNIMLCYSEAKQITDLI